MVTAVRIEHGDICLGNTDLTILPCSGRMKQKEIERIQARIDYFGLPSPHDVRKSFGYGRISSLLTPTRNHGTSRFFAYAASVLNGSDRDGILSIGAQLGCITEQNAEVRIVEAPFLGCGSGGLSPDVAILALCEGFLETRHPEAVLQLKNDNASAIALGNLDCLRL